LQAGVGGGEMTLVEQWIAQAIRKFNWSNYGLDDFPVEEEVVNDLAVAISEELRRHRGYS